MGTTTQDQPFVSADGELERIYDRIEVALPGLEHNVVRLCLWDAFEEFCRRSTYWRVRIGWEMAIGTNASQINPPPGARISTVLEVASSYGPNNGRIRAELTAGNILIDKGPPTSFTRLRTGNVLVVLKPAGLGVSDLIPSFITDDWSEVLSDGTLARLYAHPSKPYSNAGNAKLYAAKFLAGWMLAKERARHFADYVTWRFPYYATGRHTGWGAGGGGINGPEEIILDNPPVPVATVTIVAGAIIDDSANTITMGPLLVNSALGAFTIQSGSPALSITPATIAFGSSTAPQNVVIENVGDGPVIIDNITASGDFVVTSVSLPGTLGLTPAAIAFGSSTAPQEVVIENLGDAPVSITAITASGDFSVTSVSPPPMLGFTPDEVAFGSSTAPQTTVITNLGVTALSITSITASGDFSVTNTTSP